jgi:hypothetical protein
MIQSNNNPTIQHFYGFKGQFHPHVEGNPSVDQHLAKPAAPHHHGRGVPLSLWLKVQTLSCTICFHFKPQRSLGDTP